MALWLVLLFMEPDFGACTGVQSGQLDRTNHWIIRNTAEFYTFMHIQDFLKFLHIKSEDLGL